MTPQFRSASVPCILCIFILPFTLFSSSAFASITVITQGPGLFGAIHGITVTPDGVVIVVD